MSIKFPLAVTVDGIPLAERKRFAKLLEDAGMTCSDQRHGNPLLHDITNNNNAANPVVLWVGWENDNMVFYHPRNLKSTAQSLPLAGNWNYILDEAEAFMQKRNAKAPVPEKAVEAPVYHLQSLPPFFVVHDTRPEAERPPAEARLAAMNGLGFTGSLGDYTLFAHNVILGTDNALVANAFASQHSCVTFVQPRDAKQLQLLLKERSLMTNPTAAQAKKMKFAVDVVASGAHLLHAFKVFMSTLGYRQLNPDLTTGNYILVNGGNVPHEGNTAATWEFSDKRNARSATLDLTKDWEAMVDRLSSKGVAIPVLEDDPLTRQLRPGDNVLAVNNEVTEGLPEQQKDLIKLELGKGYVVKHVAGDLLELDNGRRYHHSRLLLMEGSKELQTGDPVVMTQDYGFLLKAGKVLTFLPPKGDLKSPSLVDEKGNTFLVPSTHFTILPFEEVTPWLLALNKLTLPFTAQITASPAQQAKGETVLHAGQDIVINDAWALNNQQLGFWPHAGTDRDAYYTLDNLILPAPSGAAIQIVKGATKAENKAVIRGTQLTKAELLDALVALEK